MTQPRHVVVVGGGITGLATAHTLLTRALDGTESASAPIKVTVIEESARVGGVIRTSPFGPLPAVDEGADAFLTRVPWAKELAEEVGLAEELVSPRNVGAYVWRNGLHPIPHDLLLGVPARLRVFANTPLLSVRGKIRAAIEPLLPGSDTSHDCVGTLIRGRFGAEVQEYLVDPLVGSIYAADTDMFSLEAVPQIRALTEQRSLLVAARRTRSRTNLGGPVFESPHGGMGALIDATQRNVVRTGGTILTSTRVEAIEPNSDGSYSVRTSTSTFDADAVVLTSPAYAAAQTLRMLDNEVAEKLSRWSHASVVMLTMEVPRAQWPSQLTGSGYLVPKPEQRWVTAASFGSNKWSHWNSDDRSMVLRVSLGRDGRDVTDSDDDTLVNLALADLVHHLDVDIEPTRVRVSRWNRSFPQYRPHHFDVVQSIERALAHSAPGVRLAGASYRGIGVPACVEQARTAADATLRWLRTLPQ